MLSAYSNFMQRLRYKMRVLIVEDDAHLASGILAGLRQQGHAPDWVARASQAEHALRMEHFDVMVLDLGLPDCDGLDFLRDLRRRGISVPVLILTARDAIPDRVQGLDAGADDYLPKPFDLHELHARLRALRRRSGGSGTPLLRGGELTLDTVRGQALLHGCPLYLSPKELALLEALLSEADEVVPRARLQGTVYAWDEEIESNALEVHIHNLRRKVGKARILTVRGVGYRLVSNPQP